MSKVLAIANRDLRSYFVSPLAYVIAALFSLVSGYLFYLILVSSREASLRGLFANLAVVFLLITPALTMRLLSEERRSGTLELLMTVPLKDWELVLGKYLASLAYLLFLFACTLLYPLILFFIGKPDWPVLFVGYLGAFLLGASFMAIGLLTSSWTASQMVSAVATFAISLVIWLLPALGQNLGGAAAEVLGHLSLISHQENLMRGVLDMTDLLFYLSFILGCLFLTVRSVEVYHWR